MNINIASMKDLEDLQEVMRSTFVETFRPDNKKEDVEKYIEEELNLEVIKKELITEQAQWFYIEEKGMMVGYLKVNWGDAQTEKLHEEAVEIQRIYVREAFQGRGLGKLLLHKAMEVAKMRKAPYLWLEVWEHNHRAIAFYKAQGFVKFQEHSFLLGEDKQIDHLMKKDM